MRFRIWVGPLVRETGTRAMEFTANGLNHDDLLNILRRVEATVAAWERIEVAKANRPARR